MMRVGLIVIASLMIANVAHAESVPSNAELFRMLKEQQQIISELRAELKQVKQGQRETAASQPAKVDTAAVPVGGAGTAMAGAAPAQAQSSAAYTEGPAAVPQPQGRGAYVSLFGGVGRGGDGSVSQSGTVFLPEVAGGPLAVDAAGHSGSKNTAFGGAQIGYEWSHRSRLMPALGVNLLPAVEVEGFYMSGTDRRATLENPNVRLAEQTFDDTFSMNTTVILANAVIGFETPYSNITPYIGGGVGAALISTDSASSSQMNPVEPGINHFGAASDSAALAFAAQAKAGVRVAVGDNAYVFGEYRYLYIGGADQTFGSTVDPAHAATTAWKVRFGDTSYNLVNVGVGVGF